LTIEEKLQHFKEACVADAMAAAEKILSDYRSALDKDFADYQSSEIRLADMEVKTETTRIDKETNKELALEQIKLKMEISKKAAELKEKIFSQLEAKLATYQSSPAYEALLDSQIDKALKFAGNDEVKIYIDPNDEALAHKLSVKHGIDIAISKYPFHGGLRAVIPAKNILIDNSFEKKIAEAKDKFDVEMEVL
jgi:V-type proton ATPase subunit E